MLSSFPPLPPPPNPRLETPNHHGRSVGPQQMFRIPLPPAASPDSRNIKVDLLGLNTLILGFPGGSIMEHVRLQIFRTQFFKPDRAEFDGQVWSLTALFRCDVACPRCNFPRDSDEKIKKADVADGVLVLLASRVTWALWCYPKPKC